MLVFFYSLFLFFCAVRALEFEQEVKRGGLDYIYKCPFSMQWMT